jgi:hypothetical protein
MEPSHIRKKNASGSKKSILLRSILTPESFIFLPRLTLFAASIAVCGDKRFHSEDPMRRKRSENLGTCHEHRCGGQKPPSGDAFYSLTWAILVFKLIWIKILCAV